MSETEFHVDLREYIERLLDEREKAHGLTASNIDHRLENIIERISKVETTQSRMIGVAIALMALSALIGAIASHLFK